MAYMKKNVNFGLLLLIVILAIAITFIGIYYTNNYTNLSTEYNTQLTNLQAVTDELVFHKSRLNQTTTDLKIKEQDESDLNRRFTDLRTEKEGVDADNARLSSDLVQKSGELVAVNAELAQVKIERESLKQDVEFEKTQVNKWKNKYDDVCDAVASLPEADGLC